MKVAVFIGFLACLNLAIAGVVPLDGSFDETVQEIKDVLAKYDPASITDVAITLLDAVTLTLKSASVADFSKFEFPTYKSDGENIKTTFSIPAVSANVDSLSISSEALGLSVAIPSLDASVGGLTLDISLSYTTSPLRIKTLDALAQITDVSAKGSVKLNDNSIDVELDEGAVKKVDDAAVKYEEEISALILGVVNDILTAIDP